MYERHKVAVVAEGCVATFLAGAVNGDVFSDDVVVSDAKESRLAFVLPILRVSADDSSLRESIVLSNGSATLDHNVGVEFAAWADDNACLDEAVRTDDDVIGDFRSCID
jgi:hypothetical protein